MYRCAIDTGGVMPGPKAGFAISAVTMFSLTLAACGDYQHKSAPKALAELNLGCDDDACLVWVGLSKRTIFKSSAGDLLEVKGLEYKRLKDGSQKSVSEKFDHLAFCSKSLPAYLFMSDGKLVVHWLAPNSRDGVFGYNETDYPSYLEACHSVYGRSIEEIATRLGYAVDPQFVNQEQFNSQKLFGEALGDEAEKREIFDASLIGTCEIRVKGHTYTNGRCRISITSVEGAKTIVITDVLNGYFAYINVDSNHQDSADGSWNSPEKWNHAEDQLGTVRLKGDCWSNQDATLCYRW